jgi:hypothetical protein
MPPHQSRYRLIDHRAPRDKPSLRVRLILDQLADAIRFLQINGHSPAEAARIATEIMIRKVNEAYQGNPRPQQQRNDMHAKNLTVGLLPKIEDVQAAIDTNTRERKRLFAIRRLILENEPTDPQRAASMANYQSAKAEAIKPQPEAASSGATFYTSAPKSKQA